MNLSQSARPTPSSIPVSDWTERCAARLLEIDGTCTEIEAHALAHALWESPGCRIESPEDSAERVFARCHRAGMI